MPTKEEVEQRLRIGSSADVFDRTRYIKCTGPKCHSADGVVVYMSNSSGAIDGASIFEILVNGTAAYFTNIESVVHVGDGVDGEDLSADHLHVDALGHALEQHREVRPEVREGRHHDDDREQPSAHRVGDLPRGIPPDEQPRDGHSDVLDQVSEHVEVGGVDAGAPSLLLLWRRSRRRVCVSGASVLRRVLVVMVVFFCGVVAGMSRKLAD